ncbi:MAG: glycosyltransferase [Sulfuricella denitrificans]|nr:glycosyltransferase [Sulfuricella denitrificans]
MPPHDPILATDSAVRVSVVVPVFNAENFLATAIGSVKGQTIPDWELVLVDDGSSDKSAQVCEQYAREDARIRLFSQPNRGPSAARNMGVRVAKGEFVFFMDADDYIFPDALENLLAAADGHGADMVLGNFCKQEGDAPLIHQPVVFQPEGTPFQGEHQLLNGAALLDYVRHFLRHPSNHLVSYCWARLYRRAVILQHALEADEEMRLFEDFSFNLDYLGKTRNLVFVNKPVYVYVLHRQHVSASMEIIESRRLVSDMQAFRARVESFIHALGVNEALAEQVRREVGHTLVHYVIIFLVRTCRQLNAANRQAIFREIRELVDSATLRECLPCYEPRPGNSRIVPALLQLRFIWLLAFVCKQKGNRRYGRLENTAS